VAAPRQQLRRTLDPGQRIAHLVRQALQRGRQGARQGRRGIFAGELVGRMHFDQYALVAAGQPQVGEALLAAGQAQARTPRTQGFVHAIA
jgi:hypothetical protein